MAATKNPTANGFQPWDTPQDAAVVKFVDFAKRWSATGLSVREAKARLDENRDGEPVLRVQLLMSDPDGDTWDLDPVIEMKRALRRKATELDLPFASFTMIAEREPSAKIFA
jgi:DNA-binding transcriptional MerR regulator